MLLGLYRMNYLARKPRGRIRIDDVYTQGPRRISIGCYGRMVMTLTARFRSSAIIGKETELTVVPTYVYAVTTATCTLSRSRGGQVRPQK